MQKLLIRFETIQDAESWIEKNARTWILDARHRL